MSSRMLWLGALAAVLVIAAPMPASAGAVCTLPCNAPAPVIVVQRPHPVTRIFIVNQGPVYSGPGIYTAPEVLGPPRLADYPYVGVDYRDYDAPILRPLPRRAHRRAIRARY